MDLPETITCVECGGDALRAATPPADWLPEPGESLPFVCADCGHRHDVVIEDDEPGIGPD